jgi:hypothetical protein
MPAFPAKKPETGERDEVGGGERGGAGLAGGTAP